MPGGVARTRDESTVCVVMATGTAIDLFDRRYHPVTSTGRRRRRHEKNRKLMDDSSHRFVSAAIYRPVGIRRRGMEIKKKRVGNEMRQIRCVVFFFVPTTAPPPPKTTTPAATTTTTKKR